MHLHLYYRKYTYLAKKEFSYAKLTCQIIYQKDFLEIFPVTGMYVTVNKPSQNLSGILEFSQEYIKIVILI